MNENTNVYIVLYVCMYVCNTAIIIIEYGLIILCMACHMWMEVKDSIGDIVEEV